MLLFLLLTSGDHAGNVFKLMYSNLDLWCPSINQINQTMLTLGVKTKNCVKIGAVCKL